MLFSAAPSLRLSAATLVAALALTACGDQPADNAPEPVEAVPSALAPAVGSDVGQFLVMPREGTPKATVDGTVAKLKSMPGIDTVGINAEGYIDVVIRPKVPQAQRDAIVKQMAAVGEVIEGI